MALAAFYRYRRCSLHSRVNIEKTSSNKAEATGKGIASLPFEAQAIGHLEAVHVTLLTKQNEINKKTL